MTGRDAAPAYPDAERASRTISDQCQQHAVSANLRRFLPEALKRFRFPLRGSMEKPRTAGRIEKGNFLIVTGRCPIDLHRNRIDPRSCWRDQLGRAAGATGKKTSDQQFRSGNPFHHVSYVRQLVFGCRSGGPRPGRSGNGDPFVNQPAHRP